ncbi:MAG: endonuclease MutS2 [Candidatus Thermochlorobacter aerophilum]|jgi:DNA mismatch repair protein MutS2|uniref:Endonuclease MutS2 n=1 Tax=Candidatus Thermochlorobacter aerophilus TaxID=1868324 RepID=A0A395LXS0_9BACT|nr:MAG: endonuclease MutS2 [Candidatus Thermochlorobacter aerophilum]
MTLSEKLEFDKILRYTEKLCLSEMGRARLNQAGPILSLTALSLELRKVAELKRLIESGEELPIPSLPDTRELYKKLAIEENFLQPKELLQVAASLRTAAQLKKFIFNRRETYPNLNLLTENLWMEKSLQYEINRVVDEFGEVRSSASDALAFIRSSLEQKRMTLRRKMESLMRRYAEAGMLMEESITIRNGRMVLGFRVEHKYQVPGFIHDFSQSGQTVFIEPSETLMLSNEIRDLEIQELREIERILREVAKSLRQHLEHLLNNQEILCEFDALYAKARFAIETRSVMPELSEQKSLRLVEAYHPWLLLTHKKLGKPTVPLSLELGDEHRALVITGPNAGGKSVALKTIGLLSYMLQFGFLVPCSETSRFTLFDNIFVEIGDEQSIENDLSTFSSHLQNLKNILDNATSESLVLIDEICSGTDPEEGAAIATAILESLITRRALTVVTTHQGMLKAYAHRREGAINGSMQFDASELRPTYQFQMGLPGSSFALEMARRMGFAPHILENAQRFMGENKHVLEDLIAKLSFELQAVRSQKAELEREQAELKRLTESYQQKLRALEQEKKELRRQSLQDAKRLLAQANQVIEKVIKDIKQSQADSETVKQARKELEKARKELAAEEASLNASQSSETLPDATLRIGDKVKLLDTQSVGEILEIDGEDAVVSFGSFRMKTQLRNLQKISKKEAREAERKEQKASAATTSAIKEVPTRLDLRGLMGDEAILRVEKFIDESISHGLHKVDLIHGKGTGALRKRIAEYLKSDKRIKSFRLGNWDEGGTGVTVVEI